MVIEKFPYIFKKFVKSSVALVKRNQISTWAMDYGPWEDKIFRPWANFWGFFNPRDEEIFIPENHGPFGNQISTWPMWKSDFFSLVQPMISQIFWKCMEISQWPRAPGSLSDRWSSLATIYPLRFHEIFGRWLSYNIKRVFQQKRNKRCILTGFF